MPESFQLKPAQLHYVRIKAILEPLFVLLIAPVLLPVLLLIALVIRLSSPGPLLFAQTRIGHRGRPFVMHKFRTMSVNSEKNGARMTAVKDERIIPFGNWLRAHRLDELPQLWNVLAGDMSLIGPRPEQPVFVEEFSRAIPGYKSRLAVRPGITGLAQVLQGYAANIPETRRKLQLDLTYIRRLSPAMDGFVFFLTLWTILFGYRAR
ncbi:MAG: hypothetical protein AMXMBFR33_12340 [Candidatus Xenobia bacterium]